MQHLISDQGWLTGVFHRRLKLILPLISCEGYTKGLFLLVSYVAVGYDFEYFILSILKYMFISLFDVLYLIVIF